jgi:hypothetical protein
MVGLAINGAIIVMSALKADEKVTAGDMTRAGEVVVDATRHIVSTTLTTMGGFLPLIVAGGIRDHRPVHGSDHLHDDRAQFQPESTGTAARTCGSRTGDDPYGVVISNRIQTVWYSVGRSAYLYGLALLAMFDVC